MRDCGLSKIKTKDGYNLKRRLLESVVYWADWNPILFVMIAQNTGADISAICGADDVSYLKNKKSKKKNVLAQYLYYYYDRDTI